ncbi:MAG: hypothetical protein WAK94_07790, partial [Steroidobacteraceae bacterium]
MRLLQRLSGLFVLFVLSAALPLRLDSAFGQTSQNPLDQGLQILQGLSPEQLGSIQQNAGAGGTGAQGQQNSMREPLTEEQQSLALQQQQMQAQEQQKQRAELERLSPFLQPDDWVVITVDSNPLPSGNQPPAQQP